MKLSDALRRSLAHTADNRMLNCDTDLIQLNTNMFQEAVQ